MLDGEITSIIDSKGFGFIKPKDGGADVFFHHSALEVEIDRLSLGQAVRYTLDNSAADGKLRASKVIALGELKPPRPAGAQASTGGRPNSRDGGRGRFGDRGKPDRQDDRPIEYGFVTKLHRKFQSGFISSVKHGPEFWFEARSVRGEKRYSELEPGEYVEFVIGRPDPAQPDQPIAIKVKVTPRNVDIPDAVPKLGRHPKARRRKPTWRN